jgi:hypothetical protein
MRNRRAIRVSRSGVLARETARSVLRAYTASQCAWSGCSPWCFVVWEGTTIDVVASLFHPPLLGDKVNGNLEIQPAAAEVGSHVYFFASDEAGAITGTAFSIDDGSLA